MLKTASLLYRANLSPRETLETYKGGHWFPSEIGHTFTQRLFPLKRGICESTAGALPPGFSTLTDIELNHLVQLLLMKVVMLIHSLPNKQCVWS